MSPSTLVMVLQEKRSLPKKNIEYIVDHLKLSPVESLLFKESSQQSKKNNKELPIAKEYFDRYLLDESNYKLISEWEHYATIALIETKDFKSDIAYISDALSITKNRVSIVLKNLKIAGVVSKNEEGNFVLTQGPLRTTEDIPSSAIRASHVEALNMGKNKLDEVNIELRDFSSMTIAVNAKKIPEAKNLIRKFRKKLATFLKDGEANHVYKIAIQMFPLTKENMEKK